MSNKDVNGQRGLSSIWTESLANNQQPDDKALLAHLRTVHQNNAGFTEKCASSCRDKTGRNSYEWLAEIVPNIDGIRVLDLACGSGPLLKILYDRNKKLRLKGVDMCPEELALAKNRLPDGVVDLLELKAQSLTLVDNNSIDVLLCHWALTLMDPIAPVLNEIKRVLTSKGRFAALVDGPMNAAPGYKEVYDLIYSYVQEEIPNYGEIDLGDPRVRGSESLNNLLRKAFPKSNIVIETNVVSMKGPVTQIAEITAGFFYASFILKPEKKKLMLASLSKLLATFKKSADAEIQGQFSMPISRVLVTFDSK